MQHLRGVGGDLNSSAAQGDGPMTKTRDRGYHELDPYEKTSRRAHLETGSFLAVVAKEDGASKRYGFVGMRWRNANSDQTLARAPLRHWRRQATRVEMNSEVGGIVAQKEQEQWEVASHTIAA